MPETTAMEKVRVIATAMIDPENYPPQMTPDEAFKMILAAIGHEWSDGK